MKGRARAFGLTWIAYASYYFGRKGFSATKARIARELGLGAPMLAAIDTAFLVAYALGQFVSGSLADRIGARRLVGVGMILSAAACAVFGSARGAVLCLLAFFVNGLAQSTGWPGTTKTMAAWTTPRTRGAVMGVWGTCYQVGGIAATAVAARLLGRAGWRSAFFVPAIWIAIVGVAVLLALPERPAGEPAPVTTRQAEQRRVFRSAAIWSYGACYFTLKLIRYSLLFWLPYYLSTVLHVEEERAGYLSTSFEIGGVLGSVALGLLSDRLRAVPRSWCAAASMVALAAALLVYARVQPQSVAANFVLLAVIGALLFGPDSLLSGAAAQDLGGSEAAATATGIVNGVGSLGAILQGTVTVGVSRALGWGALFYVFVALSLVGALALAPTFRRARRAIS